MRRDRHGEDIGAVSVETDSTEIIVGRKYGMDVTYTAGPQGVAIGGTLRFKLPGFLVTDYPNGVPVACSDAEVVLESSNTAPGKYKKTGAEFFTIDYLFVSIREKALAPGEAVTVQYGRRIQAKYAWAWDIAGPWLVEVAVDLDGSRSAPGSGFFLVPNAPVLTFISDDAVRLEVTIPSSTVVGEPFEVCVRARDKFQNLASGYRGTVMLQPQDHTHTFTAEDEGVYTFEGVVFDEPGIHRIEAHDEGRAFRARSNASRTTTERPAHALYWGDTHVHSRISADTAAWNELISSPADDYVYARYKSDLDFAAVTDHSENMCEEDWKETQRAATDYYEPGKFVTFTAIESSHRPMRGEGGDKNLYYLTDDQPYTAEGGVVETYAFLKSLSSKTMSIQHMHAGADWNLHDPELERVVEVYAHWGNGMSPDAQPPMLSGGKPGKCVCDALEKGLKIGFIASADHSKGRPGDDFFWPLGPYQGGLAAVYAEELTREGIWDGLYSRHCYGTTRARILVEFELNGQPMGSELTSNGARELKIGVYGTVSIDHVDIIKNNRIWESIPGDDALDIERELTDDQPERDTDYYYVHVVQVDGEQAWSSPVWVSR